MFDFVSPSKSKEGFQDICQRSKITSSSEKVLHRVLLGDLSLPTFARESYIVKKTQIDSQSDKKNLNHTSSPLSFNVSSNKSSPNKEKLNEDQNKEKSINEILLEFGNHKIIDCPKLEENFLNFLKNSYDEIKDILIEKNRELITDSPNNSIEMLCEISNEKDFGFEALVGCLILVFQIIYKFRRKIDLELIEKFLNTFLEILKETQKDKNEEFAFAAFLEVLMILGPIDTSYKYLDSFIGIFENSNDFIKGKIILTLCAMDHQGLKLIIDILNLSDSNQITKILNLVGKSNEVKAVVILPKLLEEINKKNKSNALKVIQKLGPLIFKTGLLPYLSQKIDEDDHKIKELAKSIFSAGEEGVKIIVKRILNSKNVDVQIELLKSIAESQFTSFESNLVIQVEAYNISNHFIFNNDSEISHQYNNDRSLKFANSNAEWDIMLNAKEFMNSLNKLYKAKLLNQDDGEITHLDLLELNLKDFSTIHQLIQLENSNDSWTAFQNHKETQLKVFILKSLEPLFDDPSENLRSEMIRVISNLNIESTKKLLGKFLNDKNPDIRYLVLDEIRKKGEINDEPTQLIVISLVNDSFWKVRKKAIELIINAPICHPKALEILLKVFREGKLSRTLLCNAIAIQGKNGFSALIKYLRSCTPNDTKLAVSIIDSFKLISEESCIFDSIIEEIQTKFTDSCENIQLSCLETLEFLRENSRNLSPFLRDEYIIPIYYKSLGSSYIRIREISLHFLMKFGFQTQLLFIEALKAEENTTIKCECIKGLTKFGIQNIRTLFLCLKSNDDQILKLFFILNRTCSEQIYKAFQTIEIAVEFYKKPKDIQSFIFCIKGILKQEVLKFNLVFIGYLKELIEMLEEMKIQLMK